MRATDSPGDRPIDHWCALAYLSDDVPSEAVLLARPSASFNIDNPHDGVFTASLDHTIWFHRQLRADEWHLYDMSCLSFIAGRGLSFGYVFTADGTHVATVAQEVLVRESQ
ncbi:MAG TPA: thioesterase family protein, partial [Ilumatobacteraceae bacterium]|nr:thioesterase family protein [Ilumatobacteraceae bacterium]